METRAKTNALIRRKGFKLWGLLDQTRDVLYKIRTKELGRYGIAPRHAMVLRCISNLGGNVTPAEIARSLLRESQSISAIINRMMKQGLVKKGGDLNRKNIIRVSITEKGQQALQQSRQREPILHIMSCLSEEEMEQLRSYLERLRDKGLLELKMFR